MDAPDTELCDHLSGGPCSSRPSPGGRGSVRHPSGFRGSLADSPAIHGSPPIPSRGKGCRPRSPGENLSSSCLEARSRRAYEVGRLIYAVRRVSPLVPLLALALLGCSPSHDVLVCAGTLMVVVTLLLWRGQEWGMGVGPSVAVGLMPLLFPIIVEAGGHLCVPGSSPRLPAVRTAGGLLGGLILGIVAPRPQVGRIVPFVVACSVAALMGAVGCLLCGLIGLVIMIAGMATDTAGLVVLRRA
jgi:hypothetical protein